ncbi:hypothetical protein VTO42DRAFT_6632 [Malbranchea cinnamomea]
MSSRMMSTISVRRPLAPDGINPGMTTSIAPPRSLKSGMPQMQHRSRKISAELDSVAAKPLPQIPRKPPSDHHHHQPATIAHGDSITDLSSSSLSIESTAASETTATSTSTSKTTTTTTTTASTAEDRPSSPSSSFSFPFSPPSLSDDTTNSIAVTPPLTRVHFSCYHFHRTFVPSRNTHYPLPCMTCLRANDKGAPRFRCTFCCLRICGDCLRGLVKCKDRSLMAFMEELLRSLEAGEMAEK